MSRCRCKKERRSEPGGGAPGELASLYHQHGGRVTAGKPVRRAHVLLWQLSAHPERGRDTPQKLVPKWPPIPQAAASTVGALCTRKDKLNAAARGRVIQSIW